MNKIIQTFSLLLISIILSGCHFQENSDYKDQLFSYYDQVLTVDEIHTLTEGRETHAVMYNEPIDGIYGSFWDTLEEAQAATDTYIREHGLYYMGSESESVPAS